MNLKEQYLTVAREQVEKLGAVQKVVLSSQITGYKTLVNGFIVSTTYVPFRTESPCVAVFFEAMHPVTKARYTHSAHITSASDMRISIEAGLNNVIEKASKSPKDNQKMMF